MTTLDTKALRALKQQPIERIRDAFARAHKIATGGRAHYMSIPADAERDADLILSDAIDELEALRNAAPALLDAAERAQASEAIESALQESRDGWVKLYTDANAERDALKAEIAWRQEAHDTLLKTASEIQAERNALKAELSWIDSVLARRPALDKPTRAANIEHAINVAKQADALRAEVERLTAERIGLIGEVGAASTRANRAEAEVERLREQLAEANHLGAVATKGLGQALEIVDTYKAEVERLREALTSMHNEVRRVAFVGTGWMQTGPLIDRIDAALRSAKGEVQS